MALLISDPTTILLTMTNDIDVSQGLRFASGAAGVAQSVRTAIGLFQGEWFLDTTAGVPYWQDLLGKRYNETTVRNAFLPTMEAVPGVGSVDSFQVSFDAVSRIVSITWRITCTFGDTITDTLATKV